MIRSICITIVALAALTTCSQAGLIIYEDVSETPGNDAVNVNHAHIYSATSSGLKDFVTGATTSVGMIGTTGVNQGLTSSVLAVAAGTDYADTFGGVFDISGGLAAYYNRPIVDGVYNWTFSISGLDPALQYEIALASNCNANNTTYAGANQWKANFTIEGVDSFVNASTAGTLIGTKNVANDTASIVQINQVNGYVPRFSNINPGSDGVITIRVTGDAVNPAFPGAQPGVYLNGFRLAEVPEPATMALLALGMVTLLRRRR